MNIEIYQSGDQQHQDSFWYNGTIAKIENNGKIAYVVANGDIRIIKNNELIYDRKERGNGFGFKVSNDNDLQKINEENGFNWDMNNWFEVFDEENPDGIVCDFYDEAIKTAKILVQ